MDEKTIEIIDRTFALCYRFADLFDKYIDRRYPEVKEVPNVEGIWIKGEPLPEPQSKEEYARFPADQPGRFERAIAAAKRARDDDAQAG